MYRSFELLKNRIVDCKRVVLSSDFVRTIKLLRPTKHQSMCSYSFAFSTLKKPHGALGDSLKFFMDRRQDT